MTGRELANEANAAADNVRRKHVEWLISLGVSIETIARLATEIPFPCVQTIRCLKGGLYEPDPDGVSAMIIPVGVPDVVLAWGVAEFEIVGIVDLIAFRTSRPDNWYWRVGTAWALRGELLSYDCGADVELVATPLDWLRAGGNAVCILDWSANSPVWTYLRAAPPPLVITNELLRAKLIKSMRQALPLPLIRQARSAS